MSRPTIWTGITRLRRTGRRRRRIFENQTLEDFAVLNADDPECVRMAEGLKSKALWFSRKNEVKAGAFVRENKIFYRGAKANARSCRLRRCN